MKKLSYLLTLLLLVTLMTGCKAFHTLMDSKLKAAQGAPYELIVVCNQQLWESELGDTLRSVLLAPIPYLNEREPLFNVMQFPESGFKGTVVDYRNILKVLVDPSLAAASAGVQYDVTASPQVVVTLQGPTREALCRGASCGVGANLRRGRARPLDRFRQQVQSDGIRQARSRKVRRGDEDSQRLHPGPTKR